jgi:hypothetical protein
MVAHASPDFARIAHDGEDIGPARLVNVKACSFLKVIARHCKEGNRGGGFDVRNFGLKEVACRSAASFKNTSAKRHRSVRRRAFFITASRHPKSGARHDRTPQNGLGKMQKHLRGLQSDLRDVQRDLGGMQRHLCGLQRELRRRQRDLGALPKDLRGLQRDLGSLRKDLRGLQRYPRKLQSALRGS